jgi:hypothetical protein
MLNEQDEYLHQPTKEKKWRESYYFNWADLDNKISGFSTIGIVPNEKKREFVFLLFTKDRNEVYYKEPQLVNYSEKINEMLKDKYLTYKMILPFKKWEIEYNSRKLKLQIIFETRFPTYNFGRNSSASWHQHFEASGNIWGSIEFADGKLINLKGYGQRDKSWGFRDWHQFEKWYAGHFQFKNWSATFRKDYHGGKMDLSGHISLKEQNISISELTINTTTDSDKFNSPISATYQFKDNLENKYRIKSTRMFKTSYIRFVRDFTGGYTELFEQMVIMENLDTGEKGSGMMEHLRTIKTKHKI